MVMFLTTSNTDTLVSPLHPAYTYKCTVSAYTVAEGPRSEVVSTTLPEDGTYICKFPVIVSSTFNYIMYVWKSAKVISTPRAYIGGERACN